jgi:heme-degrading monooxygenase HmoA
MIARVWHGRVPAEKADAYLEFLNRIAVPDYRATPGNEGVTLLRRIDAGEAHFLLISLWRSREAIRGFAGEEIDRARYYPEDRSFLLELEPGVAHYQVLDAPKTGGS